MTNGTVGLWKGFFCYSWLGEHKPTRWTYITGVFFFISVSLNTLIRITSVMINLAIRKKAMIPSGYSA